MSPEGPKWSKWAAGRHEERRSHHACGSSALEGTRIHGAGGAFDYTGGKAHSWVSLQGVSACAKDPAIAVVAGVVVYFVLIR